MSNSIVFLRSDDSFAAVERLPIPVREKDCHSLISLVECDLKQGNAEQNAESALTTSVGLLITHASASTVVPFTSSRRRRPLEVLEEARANPDWGTCQSGSDE